MATFDMIPTTNIIHVGVFCNQECPDELRLGELTSNNWSSFVKFLISALTISLVIACTVVKVLFIIWRYCWMKKRQEDFLNKEQKKCPDEEHPKVG